MKVKWTLWCYYKPNRVVESPVTIRIVSTDNAPVWQWCRMLPWKEKPIVVVRRTQGLTKFNLNFETPQVYSEIYRLLLSRSHYRGCGYIYVDDIVVPSKTQEEGLMRLQRALEVTSMNGLARTLRTYRVSWNWFYFRTFIQNFEVKARPLNKIYQVTNQRFL